MSKCAIDSFSFGNKPAGIAVTPDCIKYVNHLRRTCICARRPALPHRAVHPCRLPA